VLADHHVARLLAECSKLVGTCPSCPFLAVDLIANDIETAWQLVEQIGRALRFMCIS
jgi:hypothetical protein